MKTFLLKNSKKILTGLLVSYILLFAIVNKQNQLFRYVYGEKMWVHRVNSIEKLAESSATFKGFELDVVFADSTAVFDVNHPPATSINLSLSSYLSSLKELSSYSFWLDFKNLTSLNKERSFTKLNTICKRLGLKKEQLIIESRNPEHLAIFSEKGYRTSFYLPGGLHQLSDEDLDHQIRDIKQQIIAYKPDYISADFNHYRIMRQSFPEKTVLTWPYKYQQEWYFNPIKLVKKLKNVYYKYKVLSNDKVGVVLFTYEAKKGNR